jgi:hypothetical protein
MIFSTLVSCALLALAVAPLCGLIRIGLIDAQTQYTLKHDFGNAPVTGIHHSGDGSGRLFVVTQDVSA